MFTRTRPSISATDVGALHGPLLLGPIPAKHSQASRALIKPCFRCSTGCISLAWPSLCNQKLVGLSLGGFQQNREQGQRHYNSEVGSDRYGTHCF